MCRDDYDVGPIPTQTQLKDRYLYLCCMLFVDRIAVGHVLATTPPSRSLAAPL